MFNDGDEVAVIPAMAGGAPTAHDPGDRWSATRRHIIMPQVGPSGQRKIMEAKVLIIGAGGLGSPVGAVSRARRRRQPIGIVDFDTVDLSNLQRQILHQNARHRQAEGALREGDAATPTTRTSKSITHEAPITSRQRVRDHLASTTSS